MHTLAALNVTKSYTTNAQCNTVLSDVTYIFKSAKSYAIMGVSGTGKSTLMHILAGIDVPTTGHVLFDGIDLVQFSAQERESFLNKMVGLVFQEPYLIKELSVIENVMLKGLIAGQSLSSLQPRALELLQSIGLADKAHERPLTLSGGQQQRIAVLRAFFNKPAFLLADEPTGNLDQENARLVLDLLEQGKAWGMGLIISSHDPVVAKRMQVHVRLEHGTLRETTF